MFILRLLKFKATFPTGERDCNFLQIGGDSESQKVSVEGEDFTRYLFNDSLSCMRLPAAQAGFQIDPFMGTQ